MRFNIFDKFLLVLLLLCVIALSALCVATAMGFVTLDMIVAPIEVITNGLIGNRLILGGGGVVLLAIAFRLFVAMGKKRDAKNAAAPMPTSTMIMSGDNGTAYMTITAIDSLVQRHCRANAKVRECESVVVPAGESASGISIKLKLSVAPDTVIPELSANLQQSLKEYIETLCGVSVNAIDILIVPTQPPKSI